MICWECKRVMGPTDMRRHTETEDLRQTEYKCQNCDSLYVVSEHRFKTTLKEGFTKNEPTK